MDTNSNRTNLVFGGLLVVLGVVFLAAMLFQRILGTLDWANLWPLTIVTAGGLFFVGMVLGGRSTSALAIPGSIIMMVGGILWIQNTFGYWETWSYAWALIVFAVGIGLVIHGKIGEDEAAVRSGFRTMGIGIVLFLVFGALMEFIYSITGVSDRQGNLLFPLGLALLGLYQFIRRLPEVTNRGETDRHNRGLFWPVVLMGLGALWALASLGWVSSQQTLAALNLWPLLLVVIGLDLIFGRRTPWVGAILGALLVSGIFTFVVFGGSLGLSQRAPWLYQGISLGSGIGREIITGDGQVTSQERPVHDFSRVDLRGQGKVEVVQGENESLVVEAEQNLLPYIETRVAGGELVIETQLGINLHPTQPIRYRLTVKNLEAFLLSGSGDATFGPLQSNDLALRISGSGGLQFQDIQASSLSVKINGSGSVHASGKVDELELDINGSGDFSGPDLESGAVSVDIPGSGKVMVWAVNRLNVNINGSGNVSYYGDPQISQRSLGSGKVISLGSK